MKSLDLSIIIITKNEEGDLPHCLASLPRGAEVIIVDAQSTDGTVEIARNYGAKVEILPFHDYATQRNKAQSFATRTWVFHIDADEEMSCDLASHLEGEFLQNIPAQVGGLWVKRQLTFLGKKLCYGRGVDYLMRFFRRDIGSFENLVHERTVFRHDCEQPLLETGLLYHNSYTDLNDFLLKFNRYSQLQARDRYLKGKKVPPLICLRPWWNFFYVYVGKLGFLDGYPGFCHALLMSFETFAKYVMLEEFYRCKNK